MLLGCERRTGDSAAAGRQQNQPQGQKAVDIMALLWADPTAAQSAISALCVLLILYYIL